jgi:hypothetical protein
MKFAYNILEWFNKRKDTAELYFECHITIQPVFEEDYEIVRTIAAKHGFRIAELLMKKRKEDSAERSMYDTFITSHSRSLSDMKYRMLTCCKELQVHQFKVWRYKIEDTVLDSKKDDLYDIVRK